MIPEQATRRNSRGWRANGFFGGPGMTGKWGTTRGTGAAARAWAVVLVFLAGCSATPGGGFTLFPEGHRLTESAKEVRSAFTEPAPLPRELDKRVLPPYVVEPGDVLLVNPADFDSPVRLPGDQPVLQDGTISLGRYGRLVVAGLTLDAIERLAQTTVEAKPRNPGPTVG